MEGSEPEVYWRGVLYWNEYLSASPNLFKVEERTKLQ